MELLLCILILGVLAALLFPTLGSMVDKAREASCASNLRQIGVGFFAYAGDHDNTFPRTYYSPSGNWGDLSGSVWRQILRGETGGEKYLDAKVLKCPAVKGSGESYGMTSLLLWSPAPIHRTDDVPKFFTLMLKRRSEWPLVTDADNVAVYDLDDPKETANVDRRYSARHDTHANLLMADGHVEKVKYGQKKWKQSNLNDGSWY